MVWLNVSCSSGNFRLHLECFKGLSAGGCEGFSWAYDRGSYYRLRTDVGSHLQGRVSLAGHAVGFLHTRKVQIVCTSPYQISPFKDPTALL